jgi:multidrug efflux system membrane fusion protein
MRKLAAFLVVALLAGGGGYWWLYLRQPATTTQAQGPGGGRRGARAGASDVIPVLAATAVTQNVPIFLDGLGTVQASATVTIKPMIDGPLIEVRYTEGQDVKRGDVLARIDPRIYQAALDQARAKKMQDEASLANARADAARYAKLAANAYTSAQQSDTARSLVAQLEAQVASDQAQIDNAMTQLSYTTITAPIDGRVGIRQVDAGNIVRSSDTAGLVSVTTLKPISVVFTLPQQSLRAVSDAIAAGVAEVLALPQESGSVTEREVIDRGTLTVLDNQVDPTTGTIKLKATFPNAQLRLWPGAFVTVRLKVRTWDNATVVPPVAVQRGPRGAYVYLVNADSTATRRQVTVGHEDMLHAIISDGLAPGERVVIDGASRLTDGAKVSTDPPAPPGGATPTAGDRPVAARRARGAT